MKASFTRIFSLEQSSMLISVQFRSHRFGFDGGVGTKRVKRTRLVLFMYRCVFTSTGASVAVSSVSSKTGRTGTSEPVPDPSPNRFVEGELKHDVDRRRRFACSFTSLFLLLHGRLTPPRFRNGRLTVPPVRRASAPPPLFVSSDSHWSDEPFPKPTPLTAPRPGPVGR